MCGWVCACCMTVFAGVSWVVVYMCVTRQREGGQRQRALNPRDNTGNEGRQTTGLLGANKRAFETAVTFLRWSRWGVTQTLKILCFVKWLKREAAMSPFLSSGAPLTVGMWNHIRKKQKSQQLLILICHVMSLSIAAYPFPRGCGVLLLEPIPALSQGEGRVLPG